jgi:general secretion pathway protein D
MVLSLCFWAGAAWSQQTTPTAPPANDATQNEADTIVMNFQDAPLRSVLEEMSKRLGLVIIDGNKVQGRITVVSRKPLRTDEAIDTLNDLLKDKGLAAIVSGRVLRVVTLEQAKTSNIPVRSGSDPARIPTGQTLVRQIIPIRYAQADRLARDLAPIVPDYAILSNNQASNAIIYTAREVDVHHMAEIIRALDVQMSKADTVKVFTLRYADAANASRIIAEIFNQDSDRGGPPGRRRFGRGDRDNNDEDGIRPQSVKTSADAQSNSVVVSAPADVMALIAEVVAEIDVNPTQSSEVRVFPLEFADAGSTATLIQNIFAPPTSQGRTSGSRGGPVSFFRRFGRGGDDNDQGGGDATSGTQKVVAAANEQTNSVVVSAPPVTMEVIAGVIEEVDANPTAEESIFVYPLTNAKALELEDVLQDVFSTTTGSSGSSATGQAIAPGASIRRGRDSERRFGPNSPGATEAGALASGLVGDLAGKVYVVAEENTNSLLVRTAPKYFDRVREILKELDRPTRQVLIKVLIAEVTVSDALDLGAEFSVLNINVGGPEPATAATNFGISQLNSGLVARYADVNFTATLRALQQVGKLDVLSRPYLLGSENQTATITVGEEVPYITNSRVTEAGQIVNTVDYRDIGIIMSVTPYIGPDGMVILDLSQEISSRTGRTVRVSEDFVAEVYAKRSAETRVSVPNGHTVVIGGLMEDNITETVEKVPLVGDIPLIGAAFRRTQKQKQKTELLIFLCPQTALTPAELQAMSQRTRRTAETVEKGEHRAKFDKALEEIGPGKNDQDRDNDDAPEPIESIKNPQPQSSEKP